MKDDLRLAANGIVGGLFFVSGSFLTVCLLVLVRHLEIISNGEATVLLVFHGAGCTLIGFGVHAFISGLPYD